MSAGASALDALTVSLPDVSTFPHGKSLVYRVFKGVVLYGGCLDAGEAIKVKPPGARKPCNLNGD